VTEQAAVAAAFLAALAREGIPLPADRVEAAMADALALHRQVLLIRATCPADAPLPLGFVPPGAA
jgi:glycosyltransferase A (GT-A) superfamily protein (DUF2064 family)